MDMAWILLAMIVRAVWLWRKRAVGYVLAGALPTFLTLLVLAIVAMTVVDMSLHGAAVSASFQRSAWGYSSGT